MGFFSRFRRPRRSPYDRGVWENGMIPRYTSPPTRNTAEWIDTLRTNPRMAVVTRIAEDLSFAAGKLFRIEPNGDEEELTVHPFLNFWRMPNPLHEMTGPALWQLIEEYLLLKGEGYFIMERDALGQIKELWPVPVHWVQMTPYLGFPYYNVRSASGSLMQVSVEDMFVMKDLNPLDPYKRGMGQAEPLADEIETDEYAAKFQKKFFENDASAGTILTLEDSTPEQQDRFLKKWAENHRGARNAHGLAVVSGKVSVLKTTDSMKDLDMIQGRTFLRDAVLEHFGVPREIMGITENSNRATSDAAQFIYAQNVLMSKLRRREDAVNRQILPAFGENLIWRYDNIVPHNQEFDKAKAMDGWNTGLLTKDEARELMDMPPAAKGGDVYKTQFSDMYLRADEDPAEASANSANLQFGDAAPLLEPDKGEITVTGLDGNMDGGVEIGR